MPRIPRVVAIKCPHHITQRGNNRQKIFNNSSDYLRYLEWLNTYKDKYKLSILAYCLMPNHVHFVAIPNDKDSLAKTFNTCHMRYAQLFNKKNNMGGHLFQDRFYSCILDKKHLYYVVRYVENNPVRSKLVEKPLDWKWSSTRHHINNEKSILTLVEINEYINISDWERYLKEDSDEQTIDKIRANTLTGRPLGSETFISDLERLFGRRLRPLPEGRPRKQS